MKSAYFIAALALAGMMACKTNKNASSSTAATTPTATTTPAATTPTTAATTVEAKPVSAKDLSSEDLLNAAKKTWPDLTTKTLDEGKYLYYEGACVNCHGAKKIVNRSMAEWPAIIERMAPKSNITDAQKDAVMKYVLAVKMATGTN